MIVDTHTHLYLDEFGSSSGEVVERAIATGVGKMIFPNVDLSTIKPMNELHAAYPSNTYMAMGLHPTEIGDNWKEDISKIREELDENHRQYIAIGEIGIDLYWDRTYRECQMLAFSEQIEYGIKEDLPVIIHCRDGLDEVLEILDGCSEMPRGVFHSFGGDAKDVERIRKRGDFYFGINGIVTFKNSSLSKILPEIGLERILLETDSPYLAPVPFRGKRNESAYIVNIVGKVAETFNCGYDTVADVTTENASSLFRI